MTLRPFGEGEPTPVSVARFNRAFYERSAPEFDATRREPWPFVAEFLSSLPWQRGLRLLDLGCGNGRHTTLAGLSGIRAVGVDLSRELLRRARAHGHDTLGTPAFVEGDGFRLPFRDAIFDACVCVAAIHHVPTRRLRVRMLQEARRVLAPGGRLLVSAWKFPHPDRHPMSAVVRAVAAALRPHDDGLYEEGDEMVPWKSSGDSLLRFVHFMSARELETTLADAGFAVESVGALQVASKKGPDNVVAVARKP